LSGLAKLNPNDPSKIGPYEIVARLGSGGMGVVFLGTLGSKRVAIKIVRSSYLDSPGLRTRFEREIETLKRIDSPRVARFLDSSIDEDIAWHAVEFVNGPNLNDMIKSEGPLSETNWWKLASQLMEALQAIHKLGIIHRDIKPSNIIITDNGLSLIDFGISQDSDATSLTSTGMVAGSPAWLAPEQLEGTALSPATDIFSAGSVLVFAAKGNSPWGSETSMTIPVLYQRILTASPDLSGLSDQQIEFLSGLLQSDPKKRTVLSIPKFDSDSGEMVKIRVNSSRGSTQKRGLSASPKATRPRLLRRLLLTLGSLVGLVILATLFFSGTPEKLSAAGCSTLASQRQQLIDDFQAAYRSGDSSWGEEEKTILSSLERYRNAVRSIQPSGDTTKDFLKVNVQLSDELYSMLDSLGPSQSFAYAYGPEYRKLLNHSVSIFDEGELCGSE
jgi:serine/threonine protein kinase